MFTGSLVALITPFKNGSVDEKGFEKFVAWQIAEGTDGLVPCGTTGESPTLSMEEHKRVIDICIQTAKGTGVPVIAGTGSNSTDEAIELTRHAKQAGADTAMLVVPYYNKPTQEGLFQHFKAVAEAVDIPILLYNVPPRTGGDMQVETVVRLSQVPNIIGIKDASYDMARPTLTKLKAKKGFIQLSGEDASAVGFLAQGGDGCISVTANIAPRLCGDMHDAWKKRDLDKVFEIQNSNMALERTVEARFLGLAQLKTEGSATLFDNGAGQRYTYNQEHIEIALGYSITRKAIDDNLYKAQFNPTNLKLQEAFAQFKEIQGANVLNLGNVYNSVQIGDGTQVTTVNPGDYLLADRDGVVIIPRDLAADVVARTEQGDVGWLQSGPRAGRPQPWFGSETQ